jgi:aromatic-L-amino-acid decarboxylase
MYGPTILDSGGVAVEMSDFRRYGHEFVDWMADYMEGVGRLPVKAQIEPGAVSKRLPNFPPARPESMEKIFEDFRSVVVPGMTHWQHPSFFAYFPANSSPPSVLAEMLTATLAANCMSWETSPAATELETRVLDWLRIMLGLPEGFAGSIQDTASTATLCALLTARERVSEFAVNEGGLHALGPAAVYCSTEAHSSIEKAVRIAGLGRRYLRKIPVDSSQAMIAAELDRAITADTESGVKPLCVVACVGTTGASGVDSLREVGDVCRRHGVWLHVDAAWAGSALILPDYRWMIDGIESVDSFVFNPHKWLFTNFDCSAFYVRDPEALVRTFEILPEYLKTEQGARVINYRDWGIQLGRRFRALKLWFVIRTYGVEGLQQRVRGHIEWTKALAEAIDETTDFELVKAPVLSLLCFRYCPGDGLGPEALDDLNARLLHALNDGGRLYLTHTRVNGVYVIRFVVGQTNTEERNVWDAWEEIQRTARGMR